MYLKPALLSANTLHLKLSCHFADDDSIDANNIVLAPKKILNLDYLQDIDAVFNGILPVQSFFTYRFIPEPSALYGSTIRLQAVRSSAFLIHRGLA